MDHYRDHGPPDLAERRFHELADLQQRRGLWLPEIREMLDLIDKRRPVIEFTGNNLGRAMRKAEMRRASGQRPRRLLRSGR